MIKTVLRKSLTSLILASYLSYMGLSSCYAERIIASEPDSSEIAPLFEIYKNMKSYMDRKAKYQTSSIQKGEDKPDIFWKSLHDFALKQQGKEPVYLLRALDIIKDRSIRGDSVFTDFFPKALDDVTSFFENADKKLWQDKANLCALFGYLFQGGKQDLVLNIINNTKIECVKPFVINGINAYLAKNNNEFSKSFLKNSYNDMPWYFRSAIDLNLSESYRKVELNKAKEYLEKAVSEAPNSSYEELALRRAIWIYAALKDCKKLILVIRRYLNNFSNSPNVNEFWVEYIKAVSYLKDKVNTKQLNDILSFAPLKISDYVYLNLSRIKLLEGQFQKAKSLALKALSIEDVNNFDINRALLYYAASLVGCKKAKDAKNILKEIRIKDLPEQDKALFASTQAVVESILTAKPNLQAIRNIHVVKQKEKDAPLKPQAKNKSEEEDIDEMNKENNSVDHFIDVSKKALEDVDIVLGKGK